MREISPGEIPLGINAKQSINRGIQSVTYSFGKISNLSLSKTLRFSFTDESVAQEFFDEYHQHNAIEYIEKVPYLQSTSTPDDPNFGDQLAAGVSEDSIYGNAIPGGLNLLSG